MTPESAREILGKRAVIGLSTHSVRQAGEAMRLPIDYIAIGPLFATKTKQDQEPVVGLEGLRQVRSLVGNMPLVAIGGIDLDSMQAVFEAGADSVAMIGALVTHPAKIEEQMRRALSISTDKS
jgi:thiamine-phosphate pyrophosphorylase